MSDLNHNRPLRPIYPPRKGISPEVLAEIEDIWRELGMPGTTFASDNDARTALSFLRVRRQSHAENIATVERRRKAARRG